ncbi:MAG: cellulase family glycosylhydrolase [Actinoplanes sp.]
MARWLPAVVAVVLLAGCSSAPPAPVPPPPSRLSALSLDGNRLVDQDGQTVRLRGFNLAGAEYACVDGIGFFDTPDGLAPGEPVLRAMRGWAGANAVRVPLNEQCWLGLPAVPAAYAGEAYRRQIREFVRGLTAHGFVAVLDLHRSAPADGVPREQEPMPDRDHSVEFWRSVAAEFRSGPVVFDLFNEPFPDQQGQGWPCWRAGGCTLTSANTGRPYVAAGMDELITAIRDAGADVVLLAGGLNWAETLDGWLPNRPHDPLGRLAASFHAYSFNEECADLGCYDRVLAPIAAEVPLIAGEVGPTLRPDPAAVDRDCPASAVRGGGWARDTLDWLDEHGAGYTAWSWNPWRDCWSLVTGWDGAPTRPWGTEVKERLAS